MKFYELDLSMQEVFEVKGIVPVLQENGAYSISQGFGPKSFVSAKKIDSYESFKCNDKWLMAFSGPVDEAKVFNAFIDAIIENKSKEIGRLQREYRSREEQVERKIAYFEGLKK